jgi:hypothetical protein
MARFGELCQADDRDPAQRGDLRWQPGLPLARVLVTPAPRSRAWARDAGLAATPESHL